MNKALIIIKSPGIGDLQIMLSNIHHISKEIDKPVTILAQKNTRAKAVFKHDPHHVDEILNLEKKDFFNIINKIKPRKFGQAYIYSDSIRLYLIAKLSNISKIYWDKESIERAKKDYDIKNDVKNIVCGISASGPTKRWDIDNYIKLFKEINSKFPCKFFLAGGPNDKFLIEKVMNSVENCVSLSKLNMEQIIPIIASCKIYCGNDTGFGHIAANLNLKCLMLFCDSPPSAYGLWNPNIKIIVPSGESIASCGHNTLGQHNISFDEVLKKSLELIN